MIRPYTSAVFVDGQQEVEFSDGAQHLIVRDIEAFREFSERGGGQQQLDVRIGGEERVCRTVHLSAGSLALEVDEERRFERYSSRHGASGGRSAL